MKLNEVNIKRGRKKRLSGDETQHSVYIEPALWEAADNLPISRPEIIREALLNAVSFYESDLLKLKWQHEENIKQIQSLQAQDAVILSRLEQLEAKAVYDVNELEVEAEKKELAVSETMTMCRAFKKRMGHTQYTKLEKLSGVDAAKIETFLKDTKYRPNEEAVRVFYNG